MNFLALEGLDGTGKSTQIKMLEQYLTMQKRKVRIIHFPRTDSGLFGKMIANFLRGEYGSIKDVNPYLAALIYAEDRRNAASSIKKWLAQDFFVIADRYVYSNIAYQCAKLTDDVQRATLREWILNLEYSEFAIPKPQKYLFLDAPYSFIKSILSQQRTGVQRQYLQGGQDIHEADIEFQWQVRSIYMQQAVQDNDFHIISCINHDDGSMLSPKKIFDEIIAQI